LQQKDTSNTRMQSLSGEMHQAYDLVYDLHKEEKGLSDVMEALRNTSLELEERLSIIDLVEAQLGKFKRSNKIIYKDALIFGTFGGIVILVSWGMHNLSIEGGYRVVLSGTQIPAIWLPLALGIFLVLWSGFKIIKTFVASTRR